ncbi:hypothetical protein IQ16_03710 [Bradyrhizobium huanghuaihaiense]|uniref:Uncharacterized protein n=1 Tax=Bradyrhizobium huanghuaihaiense TaxID=990078 RepID=A0A562RNB1_9BRAD|nr:hypothetical protein IQ16_03710 [Bradyrhizobium huanghuaihaiense]
MVLRVEHVAFRRRAAWDVMEQATKEFLERRGKSAEGYARRDFDDGTHDVCDHSC